MRLLILALALSLVLSTTAAVFAIWPAVTDAPWEDKVAMPTLVPVVQPTHCEVLTQQQADAQTERGAYTIWELGYEAGCWD